MTDTLIWAIAAIILIIVFLVIFRGSVSELVSRIAKISTKGVEMNPKLHTGSAESKIQVDLDRDDDYEKLRQAAEKHISILGVGMTTLDEDELQSLKKHLGRVGIDILMLHPAHLEDSPQIASVFNNFFDRSDFLSETKSSFYRLKSFAEQHNSSGAFTRVRFRAYRHFQTFNMVMADANHNTHKAKVEFYTYQSRNLRPGLTLEASDKSDGFIRRLTSSYERIWNSADIIVE